MNGQLRIDEMFAYVALDADGTEGVVSAMTADGGQLPLVGADVARAESLRWLAQVVADQTGATITLARFSVRTDGVVLRPRGAS